MFKQVIVSIIMTFFILLSVPVNAQDIVEIQEYENMTVLVDRDSIEKMDETYMSSPHYGHRTLLVKVWFFLYGGKDEMLCSLEVYDLDSKMNKIIGVATYGKGGKFEGIDTNSTEFMPIKEGTAPEYVLNYLTEFWQSKHPQ